MTLSIRTEVPNLLDFRAYLVESKVAQGHSDINNVTTLTF